MSKEIRLLGIGGSGKTAGKDTFALMLQELDPSIVVIGMSDSLLEALLIINPLVPKEEGGLERVSDLVERVGYTSAKRNLEVRRLLIALGTHFGRAYDPDMWVKGARRSIQKYLDAGKKVLITGIRFPNELEMVKSFGDIAQTVYVHRDVERDGLSNDVSETSLGASDFNLHVDNNSDLNALRAKATFFHENVMGNSQ